jgi:cell wall-associated NlpC family hydrolase
LNKCIISLGLFSVFVFLNGCASNQTLPAPIVLEGVENQMRSAGYWASKAKAPDKTILSKRQISKINVDIEKSKLVNDIEKFQDFYYSKSFSSSIRNTLTKLSKYQVKSLNRKGMRALIKKIDSNMPYEAFDSQQPVLFALTIKASDIRVLPTTISFASSKLTAGLDRVQAPRLLLGSPVVVTYQTKDGKWYYIFAEEAEGWIKADNLAFCSKEDLLELNRIKYDYKAKAKRPKDKESQELPQIQSGKQNNLFIVTSNKTDIYEDPDKTVFLDYANMGTVFISEETKEKIKEKIQNKAKISPPKAKIKTETKAETKDTQQSNSQGNIQGEVQKEIAGLLQEEVQDEEIEEIKEPLLKIKMPYADENKQLKFKEAYVRLQDVSAGYLKYTRRNILEQAFKYLDSPYGWGGQYDALDCSSFLKNVFACFGLKLPRNSAAQIQQGTYLFGANFQKTDDEIVKNEAIIKKAIAAASLIYFPGHIMLYIGEYQGQPYVIHSVWGYRAQKNNKDTYYIINKVAVSGLDLGRGTKSGSFLQRITRFKNLGL